MSGAGMGNLDLDKLRKHFESVSQRAADFDWARTDSDDPRDRELMTWVNDAAASAQYGSALIAALETERTEEPPE